MLQIHAINLTYAINECGAQRVPTALPGWAVTLIENTVIFQNHYFDTPSFHFSQLNSK